jgi:hypothetical protein
MPLSGNPSAEVAPWVERLARVGYAAKGLLYITVGYLAAQAALGEGGRVTDTHGALNVVHRGSPGRVLLLVIAAGLSGYALWRLVEAVVTAFRLAVGEQRQAAGDQVRRWTAQAFDLPAGELLVGIASTWVAGYGVYQFYRASTPKMRRHLRLGEVPEGLRSWVLGVSRFGIAARGVVLCLIGFFLARAAMQHDAREAGGLRESLWTVASLGQWPFVVIAFGLVAYGVFEMLNARYRHIRVD